MVIVSGRFRPLMTIFFCGGLAICACRDGDVMNREHVASKRPARQRIHDQFTVVVPEGVSVRPYMAEGPAVAFVATNFELQVLVGEISEIQGKGIEILERSAGEIDGHAFKAELRRHPEPVRNGWSLQLIGHVDGQGGQPLFATALCQHELACATALDIVKSVEF